MDDRLQGGFRFTCAAKRLGTPGAGGGGTLETRFPLRTFEDVISNFSSLCLPLFFCFSHGRLLAARYQGRVARGNRGSGTPRTMKPLSMGETPMSFLCGSSQRSDGRDTQPSSFDLTDAGSLF